MKRQSRDRSILSVVYQAGVGVVPLQKVIRLGMLGMGACASVAFLTGMSDRAITIAQSVPAPLVTPSPTQPNPAPSYIPLPDAVVTGMLKLAGVTPDDVVYSVGSGDGNLAIAAAKAYGVRRSVGIETSPALVQLSQTNAQQANVGDRVQFVQQDLLKADFREATVINLETASDVALKLRSRFLSELKPGTRIVSRTAALGDWKPDQTVTVAGTTQTLYFWVVPERIAGDWQGRVEYAPGRGQSYTLRFTQQYQQVKGEAIAEGKKYTIPNITLTGNHLTFSRSETVQGQQGVIQFNGRVEGDTLKGTAGVKWGILARNFPIVAQRSTSRQAAR